MTVLHIFGRVLGIIDTFVKWTAGGALLFITATLFLNAMGRSFLNASFIGGEELSRLLTVWLTFLAASVLIRNRGHVAIDVLARVVPGSIARVLQIIIGMVGLITMIYLTWRGWQFADRILSTGQVATTIDAPKGLFYLPIPVGAALMSLGFLYVILEAIIIGAPAVDRTSPEGAQIAKPARRSENGNGNSNGNGDGES